MYYPKEVRVAITCHVDEIDKYRPDTVHSFDGEDYEVLGWSYSLINFYYAQIELRMSIKQKPKTPEQILAEERYTHYKAKMEAAKKDMEYWEERL